VLGAIARKWWIVLISVMVFAGLAALSSGSTQSLYSATSSVYLGQPVAANGSLLNTVSSKAATAIQVATGDEAVGTAAEDAGTTPGKVRSGLSVIPVTPPLASKLPSPPALIQIRSQMENRDHAQLIAASLAKTLVNESNSFIDGKITRLEARVDDLKTSEKELTAQRAAALNQAGSASGADRAVWAALASGFSADIRSTRSELAAAESQLEVAAELEKSKIVSEPRASKVTTSAGNSKLALGVLAGLVIGILIALVVDRAERRQRA
jgi:capsular polysaccharide biosynthesis protein